MTNSISEIPSSQAYLVIGSNTTENHPVIGSMIKHEVVHRGKKLVVVDPRRIELARLADVYLPIRPGTNVAILNGFMHVILKEGLYDKAYIEERCEGFEALAAALEKYTPEHVAEICGLEKPEDIVTAARILAAAKPMALYYSMGITQFVSGVNGVKSTANLQMMLGNVGKTGGGVNPLRGQSNVQGACDMGALNALLPAYQPVAVPANREKFEAAWGVPACSLPDKPGLTIVEMMNAAAAGQVRGLYVMGENPVVSDPNASHVIEALEKLDLLIVQDIFLTETAALAHVVLPSCTFLEKEGTVTNTERRVQVMEKVVQAPGQARDDWWITQELARRMGQDWNCTSPAEIFEEIRKVTPSYAGITYERAAHRGIQWPCPTVEHPGTPTLHKEKFARGKGLFTAIEYTPPAEVTDKEYPLTLTTGRILEHFHTGSMSRRSRVLDELVPEGFIEMAPSDAQALDLVEGELVAVSSRRGSIRIRLRITGRPSPNVVFIPFHFYEASANRLTNDALDPGCKIPEYKVCACRVDKIQAGTGGVEC